VYGNLHGGPEASQRCEGALIARLKNLGGGGSLGYHGTSRIGLTIQQKLKPHIEGVKWSHPYQFCEPGMNHGPPRSQPSQATWVKHQSLCKVPLPLNLTPRLRHAQVNLNILEVLHFQFS
jgi:hypothetical protein